MKIFANNLRSEILISRSALISLEFIILINSNTDTRTNTGTNSKACSNFPGNRDSLVNNLDEDIFIWENVIEFLPIRAKRWLIFTVGILGIYDVLAVFDKEIGIYKMTGGVVEALENNGQGFLKRGDDYLINCHSKKWN